MVKNEDDLDDIVQECCVRIICKQMLWDGNIGKVKNWLNVVTRHTALNEIDKLIRQKRLIEEIFSNSIKSFETSRNQEIALWFMEISNEFSELQRQILEMYFIKGEKIKEISKRLSISRQKTSYQLDVAVGKLRKKYFEDNIYPKEKEINMPSIPDECIELYQLLNEIYECRGIEDIVDNENMSHYMIDNYRQNFFFFSRTNYHINGIFAIQKGLPQRKEDLVYSFENKGRFPGSISKVVRDYGLAIVKNVKNNTQLTVTLAKCENDWKVDVITSDQEKQLDDPNRYWNNLTRKWNELKSCKWEDLVPYDEYKNLPPFK